MQFIIPINSGKTEDGTDESVTAQCVETYSNCARTNRRKLRQYFLAIGVPAYKIKAVFKAMQFTKERLTNKLTEAEFFNVKG